MDTKITFVLSQITLPGLDLVSNNKTYMMHLDDNFSLDNQNKVGICHNLIIIEYGGRFTFLVYMVYIDN